MTPTLRRDVVTGQWVVIAPARKSTPRDVAHVTTLVRGAESCPFCPGHEAMTGTQHDVRRDAAGRWVARAVDNRFPMMAQEIDPETAYVGDREARGGHEVIIETRDHDTDLALVAPGHAALLLSLYRDRWNTLAARPEALALAVFKNRGPRSGASLHHPHGQILSLPVVPPGVRLRDRVARRAWHRAGLSPLTLEHQRALRDNRRIAAWPGWDVIAPWAPMRGHTVWIVPTEPLAHLGALSDAGCAALGHALLDTLRRQRAATDGADYNLVVRAPALRHWDAPWARTWVEVITRRGGDAGFELSTGLHVAPIAPEETAALFREAPGLP